MHRVFSVLFFAACSVACGAGQSGMNTPGQSPCERSCTSQENACQASCLSVKSSFQNACEVRCGDDSARCMATC